MARLGIPYPVFVDSALEVWHEYDNLGWPARYLFGPDGMLYEYHFGEGAYAETERAIQELLGVEGELLAPVRPEDAPDATLAVQSDDVAGAYSGPYEAGEVWAVLEPREDAPAGARVVRANGVELTVDHAGRLPPDRPRGLHRRRARARARRRRRLPRGLLHPGPRGLNAQAAERASPSEPRGRGRSPLGTSDTAGPRSEVPCRSFPGAGNDRHGTAESGSGVSEVPGPGLLSRAG